MGPLRTNITESENLEGLTLNFRSLKVRGATRLPFSALSGDVGQLKYGFLM